MHPYSSKQTEQRFVTERMCEKKSRDRKVRNSDNGSEWENDIGADKVRGSPEE